MKRTSKFCAILFCAMLWFNPVGAQQKTKVMPMPENSGTELKMDKTLPVMERMAVARELTTANIQVKNAERVTKAKNFSVDFDNKMFTEKQKLDMVKAYMQQAFASAPKAGNDAENTHIFVGGSSANQGMVKAVYVGQDMTGLSLCNFPYTNQGKKLYPFWGTWNGHYYEGLWAVKAANGANSVTGYFTYDPLTGKADQLTSAYLTGDQEGMFSDACAYDYSSDKVYTLLNAYTEDYTAITGITFYSATKGTAVFEEDFSIEVSTKNIPVSMAIDKTGKFYIFCTDGKVYTVKNESGTYSLEEVGDTQQPTDAYTQSAAWDYRSDKAYWANVKADGSAVYMSVWDPSNGNTSMQLGAFLQVMGLASVYYVDNNAKAITDFALSYENGKVKASLTVPTFTINGDAITTLSTVEIVKVEEGLPSVWSKQNPTPGEEISQELENLGNNGETVTLAVRVKDANGNYSDWATASVLLFNAALPYANGFEVADQTLTNATIFAIDPQGKGGVGRVNTEYYEGSYSFQISGSLAARDNRQMELRGIPVEKGGGYTVSFYVKTDVEEDGILFAFDGADFTSYYPAYNEWTPIELTYTALTSGQMSLTLQGYGVEGGTEFFIDNLSVEQTSSPAAPAAMTINDVTAAENGVLQAIVNVTLPDKTMAGENLAKIDSIVFECVKPVGTNLNFSLAEKTTVKTGLTPGATTDVTVPVSKSGQYCMRALIYSGGESHPEYASYANAQGYYVQTPWIGSDMPTSVKVTATPQTDGTVALTWLDPVAPHEGYIGTVTYTIKDAAGTQLYNGADLTFTTAALALGMHTFTFEMTNGIETKTFKANSIAGIQEGMVYSNVSTSGTTESRVLNVSATAENSAFSQMLYPATNQAMYIDTLLLFATAPTTGEAMQYTKIYMGTTDLTAFGGNAIAPAKDFVEKDKLTEVFADTLRFKAGENMLKLPLKGFYYDGTKTLVIGIVKPMQEKTTFAAAAYVAVSENNMLKYRTASTSVDFDTVKVYNAYTGTPNGYAVSMVAAPGADLKTMKVTVDSADITLLENAIITIVNKGGKNMNATITTGADGIANFDYMPQGTYVVKAQKAGYIASEQEINVATISPVEVSFHLIKAKEVKVSGTVQDKGGNNLAGVMVKAAGLADFDATTNADGEFELQNVYGPGEYTLSFEKTGMNVLSVPFVLGEEDTTLAKPFEMGYNIMDVPMASVAVEDGKAVVNWNKPSVSSMVSWTPTFTQIRRLTIDNKTPFKYAQRFLPEDLAALKLGNATKALRFGFVVGSETAEYSIVLAADTTHEIYRVAVPADKLKEGEWCEIDIPAESAAIDVTKELWLIVEVSGENQDYPCAATTVGTAAGKGNLMSYQNKWYQIPELFTNVTAGNVLIRLLVEDASTQIDPANGYRVYRGLLKDEFKDYTLLTDNTVNTTTYTDAAYAALPFGQYNYAVVSDWYGDDLSEPTYTNTLNKDMEFTVAFKVTSNAGSAKDADVYMVDTARTRDYEAVVNDKDTATIAKKVWRDVYDYEITLPYHQTVTGKLDLVSDTVIAIALQEIVLNPELTANIEGKDVVVNYGVNLHNWFDDVESYEDFAIENIGDYILSEPTDKGGIKDVMWTNAGEPQSWIVFNPSNTRPAISLPAHSGNKMFAAFYNSYPQGVESEANNDYLIRPVSKGGGVFIFYCRAYSNQMPEAFEVVYSSTTADLSAFKTIQAYNNVTVTSWTPVVVNIPEDAKFVGIHCTSIDAFIFVVDDLAYYTEDPANPTAYELYLDGTKVKDAKVDELTYTFQNLEFGEHKVGVKAIYASGSSELVEKTVNVSAEAMPINLNVAVEERTAVLTWNMPEGFTPKSYKVFLGGEQKAENLTEKTYTFSELKNGTYTAAVVAVYETGESEKATVEFIINSHVDVEDFDMAVRSSVYPNPNDGMFYLKAADKGTVEVYAMNGQLVKRVEIPAQGTYSINLQNRAKGLYLMKFATRENTTLFKIVVR